MDVRSRHDVGNLNLSFPYGKVPSVFAREIRQHYFAATSYVDDLIGELLEAAATYGGDDLIVSLHSDHGWSLGQHQEWAKYSNYRSRSISLCSNLKISGRKVAFTGIFLKQGCHSSSLDDFRTKVDAWLERFQTDQSFRFPQRSDPS